MTRLRRTSSLVLLVLCLGGATLLGACAENPVGRPCFIGADAGTTNQNVIASPALECSSRTCLHLSTQSSTQDDLCTASCSSDEDCDKVDESPCTGGFVCAIAVETGPFCCKKFCQCRDYLLIPDGGLPDPSNCDSNNVINECCNLTGRRGNPDFPQCH